MRIYYAHPMEIYGSPREAKEIMLIKKFFPDAEIINPSDFLDYPSAFHSNIDFSMAL